MKAKDRHPIVTAAQRPTPAQLAAALRKRVADVIAPRLRILYCGINPGLYSAATGHHFARPGNRFWPTLHAAGFTPTLLRPEDEAELLSLGLGITNLVSRTTPKAEVLSKRELRLGARRLIRKTTAYHPRILAVLGLEAYRAAFDEPSAVVGLQGPGSTWNDGLVSACVADSRAASAAPRTPTVVLRSARHRTQPVGVSLSGDLTLSGFQRDYPKSAPATHGRCSTWNITVPGRPGMTGW